MRASDAPTGPTAASHPGPAADDPTLELAREQAFLDRARAQLGRMRAAAEALDASRASDAISGEVLSRVLARRIASLQDDPRTTLFFGRIDVAPQDGPPECFHIGRRHVSDEAGDPVVVDWRAPLSTAFYRASRQDRMDVVLRRRFGVEHGRLTALEDEYLQTAGGTGRDGSAGALLAAEIERPRTGPMRDIVSTIQPEQDEIAGSCETVPPGVHGFSWGHSRAQSLSSQVLCAKDMPRLVGTLDVGAFLPGTLLASGRPPAHEALVVAPVSAPFVATWAAGHQEEECSSNACRCTRLMRRLP